MNVTKYADTIVTGYKLINNHNFTNAQFGKVHHKIEPMIRHLDHCSKLTTYRKIGGMDQITADRLDLILQLVTLGATNDEAITIAIRKFPR